MRELRQFFVARGAVFARDRQSHAWEIDLTGCPIGDEDIALLPEFGRIAELQLTGTRITDGAALALLLCRFKKLEELHLENTRVTAQGIQRLKRGLPACRVKWSRGT